MMTPLEISIWPWAVLFKQAILKLLPVLTIERLDAIDVIARQNEGVRVFVAVHGVHESAGVIRVGQTQGVAKFMGCNHEEDITCDGSPRNYRLVVVLLSDKQL